MIDNQAEIEAKIKAVPDLDLKLRLIAITHLVDQRKQLDKEQEKEIRDIERKYNNVRPSSLFPDIPALLAEHQ
jgi:hypothetical protein